MGFLEGLIQTGKYYQQQDQAGDLADLVNYLELPLPLPTEQTPEDRKPQVIRIALQVSDPDAIPLDVQGIESINLADYPGPFPNANRGKLAYIYKEQVGKNVTWGFSPIYKLGKGISDQEKAISEMIGSSDGKGWTNNNKCRFYKMNKRVLADYEESGTFTKGSIDRLMSAFETLINQIIPLWSDRKRSYLMIFGIETRSGFRFPGQVPAFVYHFRKKLTERQEKVPPDLVGNCIICQKKNAASRTLDQVFKFSTFDKPGFLPGGSKNAAFAVFPICEECYSLLKRGYSEAENYFSTMIGVSKLNVLIVPEMIGKLDNLDRLQNKFDDYFKAGVNAEMGFFENITKRDSSFIFHFLFTEKNQAQLRLHRMVEDVPPSQFRKLLNLWNRQKRRFFPKSDPNNLDSVIRQIAMMAKSIAGKTDGEKIVIRSQTIDLIADLFSNTRVYVDGLKRATVSRLPSLYSDPDWLNDPKFSGKLKMERLWMLFEFLYSYNRSIEQEEVNLS